MAAFDLALSCVCDGTHDFLLPQHINQLATEGGHPFRHTTLDPGNTFRLFARQIAGGNIACAAVHHLADASFSDTAWCQARKRLPMKLIQQVHQSLIDDTRRELDQTKNTSNEQYRWRGHRLHVVDGTTDSTPDTPALRKHYGAPGSRRAGLGFPTSHLLLMMDHRSGLLIDCRDSPVNTHDASVVWQTHEQLQPGDVLLGDDAFSSYAHLALLLQAKLHAIMPTHHRQIVDFTPDRKHAPLRSKRAQVPQPRSRWIRSLGHQDQLVEYFKPREKPQWMDSARWEQLPRSIIVREIRRTVQRNGFRPITVTIVTTLLDPAEYPADELIELRLTRWMIETNIRHLKITLGMDRLKCKTVEGVAKERLMFLLVYNLIRRCMLRAARTQHVNVNRLSFADTLAWLRHGDITSMPRIKINPSRPGRLQPRLLKCSRDKFSYMTVPRKELVAQLRALHCDTA
jgi:hypothetical protein